MIKKEETNHFDDQEFVLDKDIFKFPLDILATKATILLIKGRPFLKLSSNKKDLESVCEARSDALVDLRYVDELMARESSRKLKRHYTIALLAMTFIFSIASYAIVVCNSVYGWGVSDIAINALIIEIPIQFTGLLYLITKSLFPTRHSIKAKKDIRDHE